MKTKNEIPTFQNTDKAEYNFDRQNIEIINELKRRAKELNRIEKGLTDGSIKIHRNYSGNTKLEYNRILVVKDTDTIIRSKKTKNEIPTFQNNGQAEYNVPIKGYTKNLDAARNDLQKMLDFFEVKTTSHLKESSKFRSFIEEIEAMTKEKVIGYKPTNMGLYLIQEKSFKTFAFIEGNMKILTDGIYYPI